jgi:hypothetical protein
MSDGSREALAVMVRGLGLALGFVWVMGFALGYSTGSWVALVVLPIASGALLILSKAIEEHG